MIKLVHVISDTNIGGAGRYLMAFLANYDVEHFDVAVVVPQGSKLKEYIPHAVEVSGIADRSFSVQGVRSIKKVLKMIKPDIVHTHGTLAGKIAAKLAKVPHITYTRHSVFAPPKSLTHGIGKFLNKVLNNWTCRKIIAVAHAAAQNVIDSGVDKDKIEVIYNGVEPLKKRTDRQNAKFLKDLGADPKLPTLAIAARLTTVKGQRYIVEAAKILKDKKVKCQIIIAGTGEESENLIHLAENLDVLGNYVIIPGFVSDVEGLMNACDIQLNASYGTEAASLALMEGMSLGKPAIVSDYGGNPELIADGVNGIITPQHAPKKIAEAIEKLLSDKKLYKQMSKNSLETYKKRFTAQKMVEQMECFYKGMMTYAK